MLYTDDINQHNGVTNMNYTDRQLELMIKRANDATTYYSRIRTTAIIEAKRLGKNPKASRLERVRRLANYMHIASK